MLSGAPPVKTDIVYRPLASVSGGLPTTELPTTEMAAPVGDLVNRTRNCLS
ncbi:MAG: hypothetical protein KDJ22_12220 [Candidatus Competibacteraceae bacterium]|nr:hypothetical protein [Candidatus Competibacteraceae bacterium]MCP5125323.1 hypothetical protein [Gammaproteobacteria bacterium]HRX71684.1 hypothetical protein [Candidatus Competibacteraceae bacterium]